ncbi:MAG: hypothetical protein CR990_00510 [Desulfococcus sp.]|nr:MAG: hypothetical protein CR990_00510 [Desulfococcus sp.]
MDKETITITVIGVDECPLYHVGDVFHLAGKKLSAPYGKSTCLILVQDITGILMKYECMNGSSRYRFDCSGCGGLARLEYRRSELTEPEFFADDIHSIACSMQKSTFFRIFSEEGFRRLTSLLRKKDYPAGKIIVRKGDPGTGLFIIARGKTEVLGKNNIRIATIGEGDLFGEMSLISGDPAAATVCALTPVTALFLDAGSFRSVFHENPAFQIYLTRMLAHRISATNLLRSREIASGISGNLTEISPLELFQTLYANQKTGVLVLKLPGGLGVASFLEGRLIRAKLNEKTDKEALLDILQVREGRYKFNPGLPPEETRTDEIDNLLKLLMEAARHEQTGG